MNSNESYVITIRDAATRHETRPVSIRVRSLLKLMLRGFGLRCVDIRPAETFTKPTNPNITGKRVVEQYSTSGYHPADETETNNFDGSTAALHRSG